MDRLGPLREGQVWRGAANDRLWRFLPVQVDGSKVKFPTPKGESSLGAERQVFTTTVYLCPNNVLRPTSAGVDRRDLEPPHG